MIIAVHDINLAYRYADTVLVIVGAIVRTKRVISRGSYFFRDDPGRISAATSDVIALHGDFSLLRLPG